MSILQLLVQNPVQSVNMEPKHEAVAWRPLKY